jgi:hypothetical protein
MIKKSIIIVLIPLVLINGLGCYSYSTVRTDNGTDDKLEKVRVTTSDNNVYVLKDVTIDSSNVSGTSSYSQNESLTGDKKTMTLPRRRITLLEIRTYDGELTGYLVTVIGLALLTVVVAGSSPHSSGTVPIF